MLCASVSAVGIADQRICCPHRNMRQNASDIAMCFIGLAMAMYACACARPSFVMTLLINVEMRVIYSLYCRH